MLADAWVRVSEDANVGFGERPKEGDIVQVDQRSLQNVRWIGKDATTGASATDSERLRSLRRRFECRRSKIAI